MISKYAKLVASLVAAALIAFAFAKTYQHGFNVAEAKGNAALADYKAKQANAATSAASQAFGKYADDVLRGQRAESQFLADQGVTTTQIGALKEHIDAVAQPHVSPVSRASTAASAVTVDRCVFTRGFVSVWNSAAGIADDADGALQNRAGTGSAAGASGTDAAADSGVSQQDILDWFVDYAARSRKTELKLKGVKAALPEQEDKQ
ncbi:TPA: hypothetical protein QDB24_002205 [Burkholderia vietnamiensis]|uniref:hypothetical protein n=1 Tax=Burkholderia vietnamiensis TaxID=60552 RepID=UPI0015939011|nr:hypothetical protein [Burkholderia vietnamiensis]MBR7910115.1 hypothetical protein [Burkholderia vietnamiensis]HDR9102991.1 hypothetical protein [Burkholderia vietnamiensis]HDR9274145.1 hypothetical protein [Burkholderia vietnamiensis]